MISAKAALIHSGFSVDSPLRAVQQVREKIINSKTPLNEAVGLVLEITGLAKEKEILSGDVATAIHIVQHLVLTFVNNESYDEDHAWDEAVKRDVAVRKELPWAFEKADAVANFGETTSAVIEGIDVQVAVNKDGSIKKGGKQVLTNELYKKHVLEAATPVTSKQFTALLVSQLGLSKSGASTYSYNARKLNGGAFATA